MTFIHPPQGRAAEVCETVLSILPSNMELVKFDFYQNKDAALEVLRIRIQTEDNQVSLMDCSNVHHKLIPLLADEMVIEVSSPGVDRPLTKIQHFYGAVGEKVKVKTVNNTYQGRLAAAERDAFHIERGTRTIKIPYTDIKDANVVFDFNKFRK